MFILNTFFKYIFFGLPHLATCIFLIFYNEPELGAEMDPGMALIPLPSSIGWGSNPQPSDPEPSTLLLDHSFCFFYTVMFIDEQILIRKKVNLQLPLFFSP